MQLPPHPLNVCTRPNSGWLYHSQCVQFGPGSAVVVVLQSHVVVVPSGVVEVVVVVQSMVGVCGPAAQLV